MKRISILMLILFPALVSTALPQAPARTRHTIITFDVRGAGTGAGQGVPPQLEMEKAFVR